MGVDTNGFILTRSKDAFVIGSLIERSLNHLVVAEKKLTYPDRKDFLSAAARDNFRSCSMRLMPESGMLDVDFRFHGEARSLKVFFECDCDHTEYGPHSISLKLGLWGQSPLFMKTVLHALSILGTAYFDENDCDDVEPEPLAEKVPTVLQAIALDYIRDCHLSDWVRHWKAGMFRDRSCNFKEFFGATEQRIEKLLAIDDCKESWDQISALAKTMQTSPSFLEDYHQQMVGAL